MSWRRRAARAFAWVASLLLLTFILANVLDLIWFRSMVPITFTNANWSGTWKTHQYMGMSGRLLVRLPEPLPDGEDFKAEALIYYPIYSVWKTGQFVPMDFVGRFSADSATAAGESEDLGQVDPNAGREDLLEQDWDEFDDMAECGIKGGKLHFKGTAGDQVVEYSALINTSQTRIVGGYLSTRPNDYGFFAIERW